MQLIQQPFDLLKERGIAADSCGAYIVHLTYSWFLTSQEVNKFLSCLVTNCTSRHSRAQP